MDEPEPKPPAREPQWITKLARRAAESNAAHENYRGKRFGSIGAASAGRHLTAWSCTCGWTGEARELKAGAGGLSCPACGGTGRLHAR